jgi:hypothetical protein
MSTEQHNLRVREILIWRKVLVHSVQALIMLECVNEFDISLARHSCATVMYTLLVLYTSCTLSSLR